jgi:hypothetical protein
MSSFGRTHVEQLRWMESPLDDMPHHAFYRGVFVGAVWKAARNWHARCASIALGDFPTREAAKAAVTLHARGLDAAGWQAPLKVSGYN